MPVESVEFQDAGAILYDCGDAHDTLERALQFVAPVANRIREDREELVSCLELVSATFGPHDVHRGVSRQTIERVEALIAKHGGKIHPPTASPEFSTFPSPAARRWAVTGKHTPGPFVLGTEGFGDEGAPHHANIYTEGEEKIIGTVLLEDVPRAEAEANAALWIAAPAMLLACELALPVLMTAVESGLRGFTAKEKARIVRDHSAVWRLREAIDLARAKL